LEGSDTTANDISVGKHRIPGLENVCLGGGLGFSIFGAMRYHLEGYSVTVRIRDMEKVYLSGDYETEVR